MSEPVGPVGVLADGTDGGEFQDRSVRKGSVRAAIENIKNLVNHFTPRNPEVARIIENAG
jgi:hypothetical protein